MPAVPSPSFQRTLRRFSSSLLFLAGVDEADTGANVHAAMLKKEEKVPPRRMGYDFFFEIG